MHEKNIKEKVVSGLIWSYAERFLAQGIGLIVSIILARVLSPSDYGVIAIVMIIITVLDVFVSGGLGSALIQKKDSDELDFSTAFYSGLLISCLSYVLLALAAPLIADFYNMEQLTLLIRVLGLRLPVAALNSVQQAFVSKHMIFKKFFFSTLFGTIASAVIGIIMAYSGFGVWSLVCQYLSNTCINSIVLLWILTWKPKLQFSFSRFKGLFKYGWKILVSDLIQTLYNNLRGLAIGKKYTSEDLAFYNRGEQFTNIIVTNVDLSINKVLFPAISQEQDNISTVKNMMRRAIKTSSFIMSPLLIGLAVVSNQVVLLLLTEKWLPCVPYLQILCIANLFQPVHSSNLQAIKAIGRSDISLKLEIIKKTYSIIILILSITLFNDPFAIAVGFVLSTLISVIVNAFPNKKLLGYGYLEQLKDVSPNLLTSVVMATIVYCVGLIDMPVLPELLVQIVIGAFAYYLISRITRNESLTYLVELIKSLIQRRRKTTI